MDGVGVLPRRRAAVTRGESGERLPQVLGGHRFPDRRERIGWNGREPTIRTELRRLHRARHDLHLVVTERTVGRQPDLIGRAEGRVGALDVEIEPDPAVHYAHGIYPPHLDATVTHQRALAEAASRRQDDVCDAPVPIAAGSEKARRHHQRESASVTRHATPLKTLRTMIIRTFLAVAVEAYATRSYHSSGGGRSAAAYSM
jgi:hypothetical protein